MNSVSLMRFLLWFHFLFFVIFVFLIQVFFFYNKLTCFDFHFWGGYFIKRKKEHEVWLIMKVGRIRKRKSMIKLHYKETIK